MTQFFDANINVTVEIAFGYSPLEASPVWTDVTDYVRGFSTGRGRSDEFSSFSPGTASVTFSNGDRRFDPQYASGDYFGDLLPMVPIRIVGTDGAANDFGIFYGFVQGWPQQFIAANSDSTVTVTAVDGTRFLEQAVLSESVYRYEVEADAPIGYYPFTFGAYVDRVAGNDMRVSYPAIHAFTPGDVDWLPPAGIEATTQGGGLLATLSAPSFISAAPRAIELTFVFDSSSPDWATSWNVVARAGSSINDFFQLFIEGDDVKWSWSNTALNKYHSNQGPVYIFEDGRTYHIVVTIDDDYKGRTYIDGVLVGETAGTGTAGTLSTGVEPSIELTTQQRLAHFSIYDAPLSSTRIAAHYDAGRFAFGGDYVELTGARVDRVLDGAGWPTGARAISDGLTGCGPYLPASSSALSYLRMIETAEQGYLFIDANGNAVFRDRQWVLTRTAEADYSDDGVDLPFTDVTIDANTVEALRNTAVVTYDSDSVTVTVDASVTAYGVATISVDVPVIQGIDEARGLGSYLTRPSADPTTRIVRLDVNLRDQPATAFPALLGLELGDVVTVSLTPVNVGSAVSYSLSVQGIDHDVSSRGEWLSTLYLAPDPASAATYFTIGDATLGRLGATYGNVIPY